MTERLIKFPSIEQFRHVVQHVTAQTQYAGKDADGNAIFDTTRSLPTLTFVGTVKLHGTNAGVARSSDGTMWCQSRENIITPLSDNAGFATFVHGTKQFFEELFDAMAVVKPIVEDQVLLVFGEWCGGSIQKGIALSQLPKQFVVFGMARVINDENEKDWFTIEELSEVMRQLRPNTPSNIHHIYDFDTFAVTIDFNRPEEAMPFMTGVMEEVEKCCPVGAKLGATPEQGSMIGEGVVWKCVTPGYESSSLVFKVKGEKHAGAKRGPKSPPSAEETERQQKVRELADQITPAWRLEQMLTQTFDTLNGGTLDIKRLGEYIKAVIQDTVKEELDLIVAQGFTVKEVSSPISAIARQYFLDQYNFKDTK